MRLSFEWDEVKARTNFRKHRVSFDEARTVFSDPLLWTFPDEEHSAAEERYLSVGVSSAGRVLVVVHTEREGAVRLISSRRATAAERRFHEKGE